MKDPFGYDGQPISVYSVVSEIDEAKATAAHYLTMVPPRLSLEILSVLRIEPRDLEGLEMVVDEEEFIRLAHTDVSDHARNRCQMLLDRSGG